VNNGGGEGHAPPFTSQAPDGSHLQTKPPPPFQMAGTSTSSSGQQQQQHAQAQRAGSWLEQSVKVRVCDGACDGGARGGGEEGACRAGVGLGGAARSACGRAWPQRRPAVQLTAQGCGPSCGGGHTPLPPHSRHPSLPCLGTGPPPSPPTAAAPPLPRAGAGGAVG